VKTEQKKRIIGGRLPWGLKPLNRGKDSGWAE